MDKPTANYVQDTSVPGTTEAETTPSHDVNLRASGTQWVHTRQWNASGDISDKTIGEIRKAIDDEFNDNVRILMCSKRPIHRMTAEPQKRRTVRISKKLTEPTKIRGPIYLKQMGPDKPSTRPRTTESVFLFGAAAAHTTCRERNNKPQQEDITVCSNETYSIFQQPKERRRCKQTAMTLHRTWIKSMSSTNNNQPSSSTKEKKEISRPKNQSARQPAKEIIRLILNRNKTKPQQNHRQGTPTLAIKTRTNKPKQKRNVQTLIRCTILTLYQPIS